MERKVIQLGPSTLALTLPSKWVKEKGIKKGSELEIQAKGDKLTISSASREEIQSISLDVSTLDKRAIGWLMSALHTYGYDEITLKYNDPKKSRNHSTLGRKTTYRLCNIRTRRKQMRHKEHSKRTRIRI